jgi:hypothetical protein
MGGGADDLLAHQASQPAHSLVQEGGELASIDSVGLRPRVAELGGFRIESKITRIASGSFVWTIESDNNPFGLPAGIYDAASEGLWVYLRKGLPEGEYEIEFGGDFPNVGFRQKITYNPIVV